MSSRQQTLSLKYNLDETFVFVKKLLQNFNTFPADLFEQKEENVYEDNMLFCQCMIWFSFFLNFLFSILTELNIVILFRIRLHPFRNLDPDFNPNHIGGGGQGAYFAMQRKN